MAENKHYINQGFFNEKYVRKNFEQYIAKHGNLDGMLIIRNDKAKDPDGYGVKIPLHYVPFPNIESDVPGISKNQQFEFKIHCTTYTFGNPYYINKGPSGKVTVDYPPEIKVCKYTKSALDKFEKSDKGYPVKLKDDATIEESDITDQWAVRVMIDKFIIDKSNEYKKSKIWGKGKGVISVPCFDVKSGMSLKIAETDEERINPDVRYKLTESKKDGTISNSNSDENYRLKILGPDRTVLDITRKNINEKIKSGTKIKLGVSHDHIRCSKQGISLGRWVNKLMIKEYPITNTEDFYDDSDDDNNNNDNNKVIKNIDDDDDDEDD